MATKKRMGGMSLSSFAKTPADTSEPAMGEDRSESIAKPLDNSEEAPTSEKVKAKSKTKKQESYATLNIQIARQRQRWLQDTAQQVRDNSTEPVPPIERVYPCHLIEIAIDLLKSQDINWDEIKTAEGLRDRLKI